jgi:hypothetical protein
VKPEFKFQYHWKKNGRKNLWDTAKTVLRRRFIAMDAYIKKISELKSVK